VPPRFCRKAGIGIGRHKNSKQQEQDRRHTASKLS
jgi:hypothetical protein